MAPPTYGDLGKSSRDVFGKGYHFSLIKLDVKTKTPSGAFTKMQSSPDLQVYVPNTHTHRILDNLKENYGSAQRFSLYTTFFVI